MKYGRWSFSLLQGDETGGIVSGGLVAACFDNGGCDGGQAGLLEVGHTELSAGIDDDKGHGVEGVS